MANTVLIQRKVWENDDFQNSEIDPMKHPISWRIVQGGSP